MSITITSVAGKTDLSHCYNYGQHSNSRPQPCYIELDCETGNMTATYNVQSDNSIPMSVYHGHTQRWAIPCLPADAANALMEEFAPIAERIVAGYECVYNGNNHVAKFSDDARSAIEEIELLCLNYYADETNTVQSDNDDNQ